MTIDQIRYFMAVAENTTFLNAAESLNISQSALSKQIINLEKELDVKLLDRSKRSASLTDAGKAFYQHGLTLTRDYHKLISDLASYKEERKAVLKIGTLPFLPQYHLTTRLKSFQEQHPKIDLILSEVEEKELKAGLDLGTYDMILARGNMTSHPRYESYLVTEDELVLVLPASHPLSARKQINLLEVEGDSFILMNTYTAIYKLCMELFQKDALTPRIIRNARVESIISAISIGEGISLLARSNLNVFRHENIAAVSLSPPVRLPIVLTRLRRKETTAAIKSFIKFFASSSQHT